MKGPGDALSLQALGQLWTSVTATRSWQRTGISPDRSRKDERRMYRCILHVPQNIILEVHLLLSVSEVYRKTSLCRTVLHSALGATAAGVRGGGPLCPPSYWRLFFFTDEGQCCILAIDTVTATFLLLVDYLLKGNVI